MKLLPLVLCLATLATVRAEASSATYDCQPFHGDSDGDPKDLGLPESFKLTIRGPKSDASIEIATSDGHDAKLESDPFTRKTINSDKFDRYSAKKVGEVLVAKEAAELPSHFIAKLDAEFDSFHGVHGWVGYNCK